MLNGSELLQGMAIAILATAIAILREMLRLFVAGTPISISRLKSHALACVLFSVPLVVLTLLVRPAPILMGLFMAVLVVLALRPLPWRAYGVGVFAMGLLFFVIHVGIYLPSSRCDLGEMLLMSPCGIIRPWKLGGAYGFLLSGTISFLWGLYRGPLEVAPGLRSHTPYHDPNHEIVIPDKRS